MEKTRYSRIEINHLNFSTFFFRGGLDKVVLLTSFGENPRTGSVDLFWSYLSLVKTVTTRMRLRQLRTSMSSTTCDKKYDTLLFFLTNPTSSPGSLCTYPFSSRLTLYFCNPQVQSSDPGPTRQWRNHRRSQINSSWVQVKIHPSIPFFVPSLLPKHMGIPSILLQTRRRSTAYVDPTDFVNVTLE